MTYEEFKSGCEKIAEPWRSKPYSTAAAIELIDLLTRFAVRHGWSHTPNILPMPGTNIICLIMQSSNPAHGKSFGLLQ